MKFLKFKKKLILFILIQIFFEANCQAGKHNEFDEDNCWFGTLKRLFNGFCFPLENCIGDLSQNYYIRIPSYHGDNENEEFLGLENQPIDQLSIELLYHIAAYLSPPDIINLIKSNSRFVFLRDNNFWLYFNRKNEYATWSRELPAVKVAFSYHWFRNNRVRKAAAMGFPKAHALLKQQDKIKREPTLKSTKVLTFTSKNFYEDVMSRKLHYKNHW